MDHRLIEGLMTAIAPVIKEFTADAVLAATKPLLARLAALEERPAVDTALLTSEVEKAVAALPVPENGKDADPVLIERLVVEAVASLPVPPAGKDADMDAVAAMVAARVTEAIAALPVPENGKDADPALIKQMITEAVAALPAATAGKDADMDAVAAMVKTLVTEAVAALPTPKAGLDGVGLAGVVIDRSGNLIVTLSDGTTRELGKVVGKDVDQKAVEAFVAEKVAEIPVPKNGADGVGFDDMDLVDTENGLVLRFVRGNVVKEFALPVPTDRGVWVEKEHKKGAGVTWGGSFWIAQRDTKAKPDTPDSGWRLAVKRGRDGKDAAPIKTAAVIALK